METAYRFDASGDGTPDPISALLAQAADIAHAARAHATADAIGAEIAADPVRAELARLFAGDNDAEAFARRLQVEADHLMRATRRAVRRGAIGRKYHFEATALVLRASSVGARVQLARLGRPWNDRAPRGFDEIPPPEARLDDDTDADVIPWDEYLAGLVGRILDLREVLGVGPALDEAA